MKIYYILQALCALSAIGQTVYANPVSSNLIENAAGWSLTGSGSRTKNTLTITGDGVGTSDWNYKIPDLKADTSYLISFQMLTLPGATGGAEP